MVVAWSTDQQGGSHLHDKSHMPMMRVLVARARAPVQRQQRPRVSKRMGLCSQLKYVRALGARTGQNCDARKSNSPRGFRACNHFEGGASLGVRRPRVLTVVTSIACLGVTRPRVLTLLNQSNLREFPFHNWQMHSLSESDWRQSQQYVC